jgi:hypothetical protein
MLAGMESESQAWAKGVIGSMSTLELLAAIEMGRSALENTEPVHPSPRLLQRMDHEWQERPLADRLAAEASFNAP